MSARASKSSANAKIHIRHACMISQSVINRTMIRLLAAVLYPNNTFFHSVQTDSRIQILVLTNRRQLTVLLPARIFLPMPPPEQVPVWEGPAPEEGTCWTYSHHCQIADKNPSKRWNGEFRGLRICIGWISTTRFFVLSFLCARLIAVSFSRSPFRLPLRGLPRPTCLSFLATTP